MRLRSAKCGLPAMSQVDSSSPEDANRIQEVNERGRMQGISGREMRLRISTWNTMGLSDELLSYVHGLGYDVCAITELRGTHAELRSPRLITCEDPVVKGVLGAGVALALSQRTAELVVESGAIGARVVWLDCAIL